jgi:hypothetical protein
LHYCQHCGFDTVRIKQPIARGNELSGVVNGESSRVSATPKGQGIAF